MSWSPGDPCANCESTQTDYDSDGIPSCWNCGASDADE